MSDTPVKSHRASRKQLEELHSLLTGIFLKYLKGDDHAAPMLNVIRSFLLNNGIVKDLTQVGAIRASMDDLKDISVPFLPPYLSN